MTVQSINTDIPEGRLLIAALSILTTTAYIDKTPDEVLVITDNLAYEIYKKKHLK